jgi:cobalt-zinc-cadmium efflux system outer membrane protein
MRLLVLALLVAGCLPSRSAVFGPVDRELARRLGEATAWRDDADPRTPRAISVLLEKPLDRDTAIRIALATNRRLQAQYDQLGIAAGDIASATVLPPLEVDVELKPVLGGPGDEIEIDVVQDVIELIQLPQRRGVALANLDAVRARAVAATIELVAEVERRYVDFVAAQQEVELRQTALDAASASADIADRQFAVGNIPEVNVIRERNQRDRARIDLARAQVDSESKREALNEVLGLSGEATRWKIDLRLADLPAQEPKLDDLERDAVATSLDLAALRADAEAAAGRVGLARVRAWLPKLGVGVSADHKDGAWDFGPALTIGLPVFNQQQGPRARANAELRRARNEAIATGVELRARARAVRQRTLGAYAEAKRLRDVLLPRQQRLIDELLKQYNAMNLSAFELLTARRDLVDTGSQYIDALRRFWRAAADTRALARGALPRAGGDELRTLPTSTTTEGH